MANFEDTIRNSILTFPGIFKNRTDVIHHLFFVLGNGYEWRNGELVSKSSHVDPLWTRENAEARFTSLISDGMSADANAYLRGVILDGAQEAITAEERTVAEIDIRVQQRGVIQDTAYVVPNDLLNYLPADITEDWIAGVEEARDLLFSGK